MNLFKRFSILCLTVLLMIGCSTKKEGNYGEELYDRGGYENLLESRDYFLSQLKEDPDNKNAKSWIEKVEKELTDALKIEIQDLYDKQEYEKGLELILILYEINSTDEDIIKVKDMIENDYYAQKEFDEFSAFLKGMYSRIFNIFETWHNTVEEAIIGEYDESDLNDVLLDFVPEISNIRSLIQDNLITLTNETYLRAQNVFFNYVNRLEKDISRLLLDKPSNVYNYQKELDKLSPEEFSETFISIQKIVNDYINSIDSDGDRVTNIKGNLNLGHTGISEFDDNDDTED